MWSALDRHLIALRKQQRRGITVLKDLQHVDYRCISEYLPLTKAFNCCGKCKVAETLVI